MLSNVNTFTDLLVRSIFSCKLLFVTSDYSNFCQDKNNWCGYNYSFSCWCNWRSLTWYFWPFRVWLKSSCNISMFIRSLNPFQVWMIYVIGQTMFSLLFQYIRQSVILRSLLVLFCWIFIAYLLFSSYIIHLNVSLRILNICFCAGNLSEISGTVSLACNHDLSYN